VLRKGSRKIDVLSMLGTLQQEQGSLSHLEVHPLDGGSSSRDNLKAAE
jgi:hypothetical protein